MIKNRTISPPKANMPRTHNALAQSITQASIPSGWLTVGRPSGWLTATTLCYGRLCCPILRGRQGGQGGWGGDEEKAGAGRGQQGGAGRDGTGTAQGARRHPQLVQASQRLTGLG